MNIWATAICYYVIITNQPRNERKKKTSEKIRDEGSGWQDAIVGERV